MERTWLKSYRIAEISGFHRVDYCLSGWCGLKSSGAGPKRGDGLA
jgi:hypothetical protein